MVKKLIKGAMRLSTSLPFLAIIVSGFLVANSLLSSDQVTIIASAISIVVWIVLMITYVPSLIFVIRAGHRVEEQNVYIGVILVSTALASWAFWRAWFTILDQPDWMIGHWLPSFISIIASMSCFYFLSAPGVSRIGLRFTTIAIIGVTTLATLGLILFDKL